MAEPTDDPFAKYADKPAAAAEAADPNDPFAKYAPKAAAKPGVLESVMRGAAEGATFGFDDKLGMDKEAREASRKANPWAHFSGELLGGFAPMVAATVLPTGVGQAAAAGRAAQLAGKGLRLVRGAFVPGEIATTGQAALQGAKLGAVFGGLSGAGHADVQDDDGMVDALGKRAAGLAKGATIGSVVGAPFGVAGHYAYQGAAKVGQMLSNAKAETAGAGKGALVRATQKLEADNIQPQQVLDQILAEFPSATNQAAGGMSRRFWGDSAARQAWTQEMVLDVVQGAAQNQTPADIGTALAAKYGPQFGGKSPGQAAIKTLLGELEERHLGPLNLLDRATMVRPGSGQNTQWEMRAAAATPGEGRAIAAENLMDRQIGAQGRLGQAFDRIIGSADYDGVAAKNAADLESAGARAYGQAYSMEQPFDLNPIFNRWTRQYERLRGPIPDAINAELRAMQVQSPSGNGAWLPPDNLEAFILARQGLFDAIQTAKKDKPNLARRLTNLYDEMSKEVANTNPAWKAANDLWRDGKVAEDALEAGARMSMRLSGRSRENLAEFTDAQKAAETATAALRKANNSILGGKKTREPNAQELAAATPQQQEAVQQATARLEAANARMSNFKVGLVRSLNDMLANQAETAGISRQLLTPAAKQMLRTVLGDEAAEDFLKVVAAEHAMHKTYSAQFGAQTTPLKEAINENNWAPRFEVSAMNPLTWLNPMLQNMHEYIAANVTAKRNTDLMKLYTNTNPLDQIEALRAMRQLHQTRTNAGNTVGKPVASLAGPKAEQLLADYYGPLQQPSRDRERSRP
jgi:hypothetical protein